MLDLYNLRLNDIIFQQDDDPKHVASKTMEWFANNHVTILSWPPQSPDLNPIENLWSIVKRNVENRSPKDLEELEMFMVEKWERIPDEILESLVDSMPGRCEAIFRENGERINY